MVDKPKSLEELFKRSRLAMGPTKEIRLEKAIARIILQNIKLARMHAPIPDELLNKRCTL